MKKLFLIIYSYIALFLGCQLKHDYEELVKICESQYFNPNDQKLMTQLGKKYKFKIMEIEIDPTFYADVDPRSKMVEIRIKSIFKYKSLNAPQDCYLITIDKKDNKIISFGRAVKEDLSYCDLIK